MQLAMDGHIHLYECYDLDVALCGLHDRLRAAAPAADRVGGILMERAGGGLFAHAEREGAMPGGRWQVRTMKAGEVVVCSRAAEGDEPVRELVLVAGRQVVVREGFEVLAVGARDAIAEGEEAGVTCAAIRSAGGVPVLSWAFGKWWLQRALPVARLLWGERGRELAVGDTTIRPRGLWSTYLGVARLAGRCCLPGTDPLPEASEAGKLGQLGFLAEVDVPLEELGAWLRRALAGRGAWREIGPRDGVVEVMARRKAYQRAAAVATGTMDWQGLAGEPGS